MPVSPWNARHCWLDVSQIGALALPLIMSQLAQVALTTVDIIMLGMLSPVEIAAGGLALSVFNLFRAIFAGLVMGTGNLVAEADGVLVGLVHYLFHRSTTLIEPNCSLQDLFTSEGARGRGVGEALIRAVYAAAKAAGGSVVYWHTHETNATAQALYDKLAEKSGFIVYRKLF